MATDKVEHNKYIQPWDAHKVVSRRFVVNVTCCCYCCCWHFFFPLLLVLLLLSLAAPLSSVRCSASTSVREISINYLTSCCQQKQSKQQHRAMPHVAQTHTHTHTHIHPHTLIYIHTYTSINTGVANCFDGNPATVSR